MSIPAGPSETPRDREAAPSALAGAVSIFGVYIIVAALFGLGCVVSPKFLTETNLLAALQSVTLVGIVAVGLAFITYSKHYVDLSIPGIIALSGVVAVWALQYGFVASLAAGLGAGLLVGVVNGLAVGYLRLNPIIWTLAMGSILPGLIRWVYEGKQLYPDEATAAGRAFRGLYDCLVFGHAPLPAVVLALAAAGGYVLMHHTAYGASLKLTGSNYAAARLSGAPVRRVVAGAFVISSLTSASAGVLLASFNKVGAADLGRGYEFTAITAVVLGGLSLAGGRGNMVGVLGGVAAMALLTSVMSLVRIPAFELGPWSIGEITLGEFTQNIVRGAVFILTVGLHSYSLRKAGLDDS